MRTGDRYDFASDNTAAICPEARSSMGPMQTFLGWLADVRRDLKFCARQHQLGEFPYSAIIRWQQRRARLAGFKQGWSSYREPSAT